MLPTTRAVGIVFRRNSCYVPSYQDSLPLRRYSVVSTIATECMLPWCASAVVVVCATGCLMKGCFRKGIVSTEVFSASLSI
jgi:hypothetical protein